MNYYSPKEIVEQVNKVVKAKVQMSNKSLWVMAFLAGAYIALGSLLAIVVGGGLPGIKEANPGLQKFIFGAVFPVGLMLVAIAGADLFTGNTAYFAPSLWSKKVKAKAMFKNWGIVWGGNFIGSLFVAYFLAYHTDLFAHNPWLDSTVGIAIKKTSAPFYKVFLKGIGCNWMVALAMWMAYSAKDTISKIMGIWFPIMAFVAMGYEHCVANMFFIPTAMFYGADISVGTFVFNNLIPATLGNIVGGFLFVGTLYWFVFQREDYKSEKLNKKTIKKELEKTESKN